MPKSDNDDDDNISPAPKPAAQNEELEYDSSDDECDILHVVKSKGVDEGRHSPPERDVVTTAGSVDGGDGMPPLRPINGKGVSSGGGNVMKPAVTVSNRSPSRVLQHYRAQKCKDKRVSPSPSGGGGGGTSKSPIHVSDNGGATRKSVGSSGSDSNKNGNNNATRKSNNNNNNNNHHSRSKSTTTTSSPSAPPSSVSTGGGAAIPNLLQKVKDAHQSTLRKRSRQRDETLRKSLSEFRDAVFADPRCPGPGASRRIIRGRLPSNDCERRGGNFPHPGVPVGGADDESSGRDKITVKIRSSSAEPQSGTVRTARPTLYLEGTHKSRPPSTATIFLKSHFAIEDEQNLTYVPYFGDDDKEDVVSEFFDIEARAKSLRFGAEYKEQEVNDCIDDVLRLLMEKKIGGIGSGEVERNVSNDLCRVLAKVMNVEVERVKERYKACCVVGGEEVKKGEKGPGRNEDKMKIEVSALSRNGSSSKRENDSKEDEKSVEQAETYEGLMNSFRDLFCRRCFSYDCNMHGNLAKPDLDVQTIMAAHRETDGYWDDADKLSDIDLSKELQSSDIDDNTSSSSTITTNSKNEPKDGAKSSNNTNTVSPPQNSAKRKRSCPFTKNDTATEQVAQLSASQKALAEHAFLVFKGDTQKIAKIIQAKPSQISSLNFSPSKATQHHATCIILANNNPKKKKVKGLDKFSMKNYNSAWLKRVKGAEIHPAFFPCDHSEPCSDDNCTCVQNAYFCTKHCIWGDQSRNFFRGCACKAGKCRTKSCTCFAAKRECDPDLCRCCGAGSDPPNQPACDQRCRNDNIGMRRHCHLLLAESKVKDAGWGIYTKHALKKGDFVHEYVGEVISQEEAERRGRIYDKVNRSYLFNLSSDFVVDASRKGNKTKFANHSSKPNCYTKTVCVNGDTRIGLFAKEDIEPQSELFFDYRYDVGIDNELIHKPGKTVEWMKNPKMANKISKKYS